MEEEVGMTGTDVVCCTAAALSVGTGVAVIGGETATDFATAGAETGAGAGAGLETEDG